MDTATAEIGAADDNLSTTLPMVGVDELVESNNSEESGSFRTGDAMAEEDGGDEPEAAAAAAEADADDDPNVGDDDDYSSSEEESSSSSGQVSSSEDDDDDDVDDNDAGDDGQSNSGLSEYELLRLKRIERNKARLAELGLAGGSIAKKSGHGKKRAKKKEKSEEDQVATRNQPKRAKKSALTHEQLYGPSIARYKRRDAGDKSKTPRTPKKEKYIPGTCFGCKVQDDEQRIYCAYCRHQWHPDCHEPKVALPLAEGTLFRCGSCEGKSKRLACGFCEPCNRTEACGGCTYCVDKTQNNGIKKKKCVYSRCLVMFNIQPQIPGTKPLTLRTEEGPKKDEVNGEEGFDAASAQLTSAAAAGAGNEMQVNGGNGYVADVAAKKPADTSMDVSHHEDRCFACKDGGVLICCDDCERVWHPACHKPMVLNVYSKLHCMECKREEQEAAMELRRKQDKERRNQRRLASGALAGTIDGELVFVSVVGPSPCCAICGIQRHKFKPIPLPPAKRVLYASIDLAEEKGSENTDEASVEEEKDGEEVPLTTNVPKDVEVLNARSMRKVIKTFSSCSEAAREMAVNRSKLSRLCRKGGGAIGVYYYRYASVDDEGEMENVSGTSRKRKRKKKKKSLRPQKVIECVVKWPRDTFDEATAKQAEETTARATILDHAKREKNADGSLAIKISYGSGADALPTSTPTRASSVAPTRSASPLVPTSTPQVSSVTTDKDGGAPQQSDKRTAAGKPACSYGDCPKQSQGRRFNYMCLVHFNQTTAKNATDATPSDDAAPATPPQISSLDPSSTTLSTTFIFPGSGVPQQSDRLTETGKPACAYADCPKHSQGRRLNFMCMSHFKSITGGKMIEIPTGGAGAQVAGEDFHDWVCDNCGLTVAGYISRCKCYRWRDGIHPMSKKKKKLRNKQAQDVDASKVAVDTAGADDEEEDKTDWVCDQCGRTVPGKLSRCKCYRWRDGIHPMSKKKQRVIKTTTNQNYSESLDSGSRKRGDPNEAATVKTFDANKTDNKFSIDAVAEKPKVSKAPNVNHNEAVEASNLLAGMREADEMQFAHEPVLDATLYDSDGDDVSIRVSIKWPHENPDVRRSDDMIYCNTCGEWYHLHCVSPPILDRDKGGPRGRYKCQKCTSTGRIRTYKVSSSKRPSPSADIGPPAAATENLGSTASVATGVGTGPLMRKTKCGQCDACRRPDCGQCANCRDKKKFGGPHKHRQRCEKKTCTNPQHRPLMFLAPPASGVVSPRPIITNPLSPNFASPPGQPTEASEARYKASIPSASTATIGEVTVNTETIMFDQINGQESHRYDMQWSGGKVRRVMKCRVDNCTKNSRGKKFDGYCLSHFNEAFPNVAVMGTLHIRLCKVVGCVRNSRGSGNKYKGMCCLHHNESVRGIVHQIKETNEPVLRPKKIGVGKKFVEPTKVGGQGISSMGESGDVCSKASPDVGRGATVKDESMRPLNKHQREDPEAPGDDAEKPEAKEIRGGMEYDKVHEEIDPIRITAQNEDDDDASVEPKPKKMRIKISVGHPKAGEEVEKSSRSENGEKRPQKGPGSSAKSAPPTKKLPPLGKRNKQELDPVSKKILKAIKTAEKYPDDAKKQDQVCEALRKHANDLDTAATVVELGGLEVIAAAMKKHDNVAMVQAEAIGTVADLVWIDSEHGKRVAELGFMDLIASAMERHGSHPKINKLGCGFFRTCSYDKVNADLAKEVGTEAVTNSMKRNPRKCDVLKEGSAFLQNMLVVYPDLTRTVIRQKRGESEEDGIVPILVNALKNNSTDAKLHDAVCGVLANVALIGTGKSAIIKAGAIPILLRVLKNAATIDGEIGLKRTLLSFLALVATDDDSNVEAMVPSADGDGSGVEDTISIIKQHSKDSLLLVAAFGFLKAIAEHSEQVADGIVRSGAVKLVVLAMDKQAGFDQIQTASCALLAVIKHDGSKTSVSAAKRVIGAMQSHEDDPSLLEEACHALHNLAACASNVLPFIKTKDVLEILAKIKEDHPEECGEVVDELFKLSSLRSFRRT